MGRALFHSDNAYKIQNVRSEGFVCVTNTVSNTAFRGFGAPQGMLTCEAWIEHLAATMKIRPEELRQRNLYAAEGARTHFHQLLDRCPLRRIWGELAESSDFERRRADTDEFNSRSRWRKRGIAMLPTKFGISFTALFMNQGGALVHVYGDGTVLVTHGGTEMGQGLHTKMIQVAARALAIPMDDVTIRETSTDTVPNTTPTAASASSDLYGMAILDACEQIMVRLQPYLGKSGGDFKKAVSAAYFDRCDLSAHGFYKTPDIGYDFAISDCRARGRPFNYFTFGTACAEVEIDVLTGDMRILRADIIMDVGNSLNPAIDIGQIEGAFMQGVGWSTLEEYVLGCDEFPWIKKGMCHTRGPGTYKIPSFNDVPIDMRVTLLKDNANPRAIHSSRAVGEPPLFLGAVAWNATRAAIASARLDAGLSSQHFTLESPLTPERIRMSCGDKIGAKFAAQSSRGRPSLFV
jgi:xanthine dehydrogenase/oxidase